MRRVVAIFKFLLGCLGFSLGLLASALKGLLCVSGDSLSQPGHGGQVQRDGAGGPPVHLRPVPAGVGQAA